MPTCPPDAQILTAPARRLSFMATLALAAGTRLMFDDQIFALAVLLVTPPPASAHA